MAVRYRYLPCSLLLLSSTAFAGSVTGTVTPPAGGAGKPPLKSKAYLARMENPLVPVKPLDPMPYIVVVLDKAGIELPQSPQVHWKLLGECFDQPLLPVVAGTEVVIANAAASRKSVTLFVEGLPDLLPETPLNPTGTRGFEVGQDVGKLLVLGAKEAPHLAASVLVLATPYFAIPDKDGKYTIPNVKDDGTYTVKVWYRDGWVEGSESTVVVDDGKATKNIELKSLKTVTAAPPPAGDE